MATLLEKALAEPRKGAVPKSAALIDETFELAMAYCAGEVTGLQVAAAIGRVSHANITNWIGGCLLQAVRRGLLVRKP
jgi:hypothetical protein